MAPIKKPQSSYLIFCNEKRKEVNESHPGLRIGEIQKLLSVQWKELTLEDKDRYTELAAKDKERYERERLENPIVVEDAAPEGDDASVESHACVYPLGRVKKIIQSDPDVGKVSREALIAIAKASELFAQFLATKSYEQTLFQNKRQIKHSDVTRTIHTTGCLDWLREDFPDVKTTTAAPNSRAKDPTKDKPAASSFFQSTADRTGAAAAADNTDEQEGQDAAAAEN